MARIYGKVSMEMWGDDKFCSLSRLQPSGQALWLYLLTGRFRTSIPGLNLNVGLGALSDRMGWRVSQVERCWKEITDQQMADADWRHGVIWMPRGIEHNEPESPNVIRGWGRVVLPECELVTTALESLRGYITSRLSKAFSEAFEDTFGQVSSNQEQEQEQEQDQFPPQPPAGAGGVRILRADRKTAEVILRNAYGCPHEPRCPERAACLEQIAAVQAEKRVTARRAS